MLVLSRKMGEQIVINGNIILTVVSAERGKARIGIEAPREIVVDRKEISDQKNYKSSEVRL